MTPYDLEWEAIPAAAYSELVPRADKIKDANWMGVDHAERWVSG